MPKKTHAAMDITLMNTNNFIHYLEERLYQWAEWYSRGNFSGLGYPSCSIEYRVMTEGNVFRRPGLKPLPIHAAAEEIERLVNAMAQQNPVMVQVLRCHYFNRGSLRYKAKKLAISHTQFKNYVDMAHQWLLGRLSGRLEKD
ncbi:hypothetical protein [Candidatus Fukatsuia endosymbiont of Tuberolachnus salignus]|uniref:hypothetical protein n=1 Tax=Candidatus Fukatsuia endosymbiont of Tuberolachnus salignus TaxID=3077957 RepID=UPI00313F1A63